MADIRPFRCMHPSEGNFEKVAALPYDVFNRDEAKEEVKGKPESFLNIDRPDSQYPAGTDIYADCVYDKARELFEGFIEKGLLCEEEKAYFYIYTLTMDGREQNGIVACSSVDDYLNGTIKKHEFTLAVKEEDRIRHVDSLSAQTGPIFLAYRGNAALKALVKEAKEASPMFDFVSEDGIRHQGFMVADEDLSERLEKELGALENTYIADGHHRCASAAKVALKRRSEHPDYSGREEFNYFLSVLFSDDELKILPYNRVVRDLNGLSKEVFLEKISEKFEITQTFYPVSPSIKGKIGMFLDNEWYELTEKDGCRMDDSVEGLDVAFLQREVLTPIFGISDPKKDPRIEFVGGIRGIGELEMRVHTDMAVAFSMHPTSIGELFAVADDNRMMPPKSTWFEPKLRSGLFIHRFER